MTTEEIKELLTLEDIYNFVEFLGGEPQLYDDYFTAKTICHGGDSHKLYYYENSKSFCCYTNCGSGFDVFELVIKKYRLNNKELTLPQAIIIVCDYFNINVFDDRENSEKEVLPDWNIFKKWKKRDAKKRSEMIYNIYDQDVIKYYPQPRIPEWESEGILKSVCDEANIKFDPVNLGIIIPHYNMNGELIGIRERTLIKENEKDGKYKPAILKNKMYNHALGFNLYNLNHSKDNIKKLKTAIIFESEKSALQYRSFNDVDISVACCGSNLTSYQMDLLYSLGVNKIIICFDKQFKELGDKEHLVWVEKLKKIGRKFNNRVEVYTAFDKWNVLDYKMSPTDKGKEVFNFLLENKVKIS